MASIIHHSTETATPRLKEFHIQPIFDVTSMMFLETRLLRWLRGSCDSYWCIFIVKITKIQTDSVQRWNEKEKNRKMFRWLFVFVQVMANQEVVTYLSESMLVWACSVRRPEGYRVSQVVSILWAFPPLHFHYCCRPWERVLIPAWQWLYCVSTEWL